MKIEMDDNSSITTTICVIVIVAGLLAISGCHMTEETNRLAIKSGLVQKQQQVPSTTIIWTKP